LTEGAGPGGRRRWYYGWNIVAVLIVCQMAAGGLTHNSLSLFLNAWSQDLHAPVSFLTLAITAQILAGAPMSPIAGALADKYPSRLLFTIGLSGMAVFFVAISFATRAWHIVALYALVAPVLTMCTVTPVNALISRWFVKRIGLALGITAFGLGLGGVLMPPLIAALLPEVGWRMIWRGAGVLVAFVVIPLILLVVRNAPTAREGLHYLTADGGAGRAHGHGHSAGAAASTGPSWIEVLSRRNFWLLVFINRTVMGMGSAMHQNMVPYAVSRGMSNEAAALLLSAMSVSHLVATLGLGLLTDRFGCRLPLAGLAVIVAVGLGMLVVVDTLPLLIAAAVLIGFNTGVFTPMAAAISVEFGSAGFGKAFGLAMFFLPLMSPFAFVLARTEERTGSYGPALLGFVGVLAIAAVLSLLLRDGSPQDSEDGELEPAFK
jgi:MFS family permease